jgi:UPF0755 protein
MKRHGSRAPLISILIVGILLFAGIFAIWSAIENVLLPASSSSTHVTIDITAGESTTQIADELQQKGVIRNALAFRIWSRIKGLDTQLKAGRYTKISPNMNISQIVGVLQQGQPDELPVFFAEGTRLQQIADTAASSNLSGFNKAQFLQLTSNFKAFPDAKNYPILYNSVPDGASMEGLLFPSTYYLAPTTTARQLIDSMLSQTVTQIQANGLVAKAQQHKMTIYDALTLASIVQREAGSQKDMGGIASAYWNRVYTDNGQTQTLGLLQADPTVQYARDTENPPSKYWTPLTDVGANIAADSKWNTYINPGFPPTPICSPSLASMIAAAAPPTSDNIYFFADKHGITHFAATNDQFNQEEAQYGVSQ